MCILLCPRLLSECLRSLSDLEPWTFTVACDPRCKWGVRDLSRPWSEVRGRVRLVCCQAFGRQAAWRLGFLSHSVVKLLGGRVLSLDGVVELVGDTEQAVAVSNDC